MISLIAFFLFSAHADRVGNGGNIAEKNVTLAYVNMNSTFSKCLATPHCLPKQSDRDLLMQIQKHVELSRTKNSNQLQFLSGSKHPEIFGSFESAELWATSIGVGSTIYINTDLIVTNDSGKMTPISIEDAVRFLFVSLGYQSGVNDLLRLDQLAYQLLTSLKSKVIFNPLSSPRPDMKDSLSIEQWILTYFQNMPLFLELCIEDSRCDLTDRELSLAKKIHANMSQEATPQKILRYDSSRRNPSLFLVDGVIKSAVTGLNVGDPIYFNLEFLYEFSSSNELSPISSYIPFALLLHELGHHTGETDHQFLDIFSEKIANYYEANFPYGEYAEEIDFSWFHKPGLFRSLLIQPSLGAGQEAKTKVVLADELQFVDMNKTLESVFVCPAGKKLVSYRVNSVRWNQHFLKTGIFKKIPYQFQNQPKEIQIELQTYYVDIDASLLCRNQVDRGDSKEGQASLVNWKHQLGLTYSNKAQARELENFVYLYYYLVDVKLDDHGARTF